MTVAEMAPIGAQRLDIDPGAELENLTATAQGEIITAPNLWPERRSYSEHSSYPSRVLEIAGIRQPGADEPEPKTPVTERRYDVVWGFGIPPIPY